MPTFGSVIGVGTLGQQSEEEELPTPEAPTPTTTARPTMRDVFGSGGSTLNQGSPDAPTGTGSTLDASRAGYELQEGARLAQTAVEGGAFPSYEEAPDQVDKIVQTTQVLYQYGLETGDEEMVDYARFIRTEANSIVPPEVQAKYGWDQIEQIEDDRNFLERSRDTALNAAFGDHPVGRFVSKAFEIVDRPSQGVLGMLAQFTHDDENRVGSGLAALGRGLTFQEQPDDFYGIGVDNDEDGHLNLREAFNQDAEAGGRLAGLFDTIGVAILDPTTYLGVGLAQRAKAGLGAVAATQGDDVARLVARQGIGVLDDTAQAQVKDFLEQQIGEAAERASQRMVRGRLFPQAPVAGQVDDAMQRISTPTGNLRVGGANVRTPLDPVLNRLPGRRQVTGINRVGQMDLGDRVADADDAALSARNSVLDRQLPDLADGTRRSDDITTVIDDLPDGTIAVGARQADGSLAGHLVYDIDDNSITGMFVDPAARGAKTSHHLYDELGDLLGGPEAIARINREGAAGLTEAGEGALRSYLRQAGVAVDGALEATVGRQGIAAGRVGQAVSRGTSAIRPRATIRRELGERAEEVFDHARVRRSAQATNDFNDAMRRLSARSRKAADEVGEEEADRIVRQILEEKGVGGKNDLNHALDRADDIRASGLPATADYLAAVARVRDEIDRAAMRGGLDEGSLRRGYFPRTLTEEGREALADQPHKAQALGLDAARLRGRESRHWQARTYKPDLSLEDANRFLAKDLGVDPGIKMFEDNVLAAYATRGDAAFRAAADMDMLRGLQSEMIGEGADRAAMVVRRPLNDAGDWEPPKGYRELRDADGGFFAHRHIADELEKVRGYLTNDGQLEALSRFMNEWSKTWGGFATASLHKGIGFHNRNALGNVLLNAVEGVVDPTNYTRAARIQRTIHNAYDAMAKSGDSFDDALRSLDVDDADRLVIHSLRENSIIDDGWFDDLSSETMKPKGTNALGRTKRYESTWDVLQNNPAMRAGRTMGSTIEHNARIAHFVAKLDAPGGTVDSAARSVRKTLFDYSDLTGFERQIRNVSRFYTFMRKNTALQMHALLHYPGRINTIERATGGSRDYLANALGMRQDYSQERGDTLDVGSILGLDGELAGGLETPFKASLEVMAPLANLADMATGGESSGTDVLRSLAGLTAGGQTSFIDAIYQQLTGQHLAFERELTEEEMGSEGTARRWFDALIGPAWSSLDTTVERLTEGEGVGPIGNQASSANEEFGQEAFILSNIMGLNQAPLDTETEAEVDYIWTQFQELDNMLRDLRKDDPNVPTIEQLRRAGILPELPSQPARARSISLQEQIEEDRAAGLPTDALEEELAEQLASEREQGYQIAEDGSYTTQSTRLRDFAGESGIYVLDDDGNPKLDEDGEPKPSTGRLAQVLWNKENPGSPYLDDDGTPYDYYDLQVEWPTASEGEALEWLREQGVTYEGEPISERRTRLNQALRDVYNEAHPDRPQLTVTQRIEAGIRPTQGVYIVYDGDTAEFEIWPEGMSADNWTIEPNAQVRGTRALDTGN